MSRRPIHPLALAMLESRAEWVLSGRLPRAAMGVTFANAAWEAAGCPIYADPAPEPECRIGGSPPELVCGMVVHVDEESAGCLVTVDDENFDGCTITEVRAPWGGPTIWRAK